MHRYVRGMDKENSGRDAPWREGMGHWRRDSMPGPAQYHVNAAHPCALRSLVPHGAYGDRILGLMGSRGAGAEVVVVRHRGLGMV